MIRNYIYIALIIIASCNKSKQTEVNDLKKTNKYKLTATTPDGKEVKQVISNKQMNQLMEGFSKKMKKDTIFNEFDKPKTVIHKLIGETIYERFKYNDKQQLVSQYGQTDDSSSIAIYNEVSKIKYQYKNDLLVEIKKYNVDNNLISSKWEDTPIIQYKYDSKKQLIEKWFLNEIGELRGEYSILKYDKNGKDYDWYNLEGNKKLN